MSNGPTPPLFDTELFRAALDGMEELICICSEDDRILYMNRAMIARTGRDAPGEPVRQVLSDLYEPCSLCGEKWEQGAGSHTLEVRSSKDCRSFSVTHMLIPSRGGGVARLAMFRDVTEQRETEAWLKESTGECVRKREELQCIFKKIEDIKKEWERTMDCLGDLVLLVDPDGGIVRCNRPARDFFGASYEALKGRDWRELFEQRLHVSSESLKNGEELFHGESEKWYMFNNYPFAPVGEGGRGGFVITLHDTTELRKSREETETAYEKLAATHRQLVQQEKMAAIGQLAAGVAHEINNPIGFVNSNLGTLGKYMGRLAEFMDFQEQAMAEGAGARGKVAAKRSELKIDRILADAAHLVHESLEGTERVRRIVQDLKSFSHAEEEEQRGVDLNECLESTVNIVWNELKYKATVVKEYGELPLVRCWPQQLNQVFMNLLMNAAQAIDKQGEIRLRTWREGSDAFVSVSDNGCGIEAEDLARVFEPFFTTKEVGKGTGLGLSISFDIVKRHGGEISVTSEVGKGSTFTVRIPVDG